MPGGEEWAEEPPAWTLPVTVAGDLVLVREAGVLVSVDAVRGEARGTAVGSDSRQHRRAASG